MSRPRNQGSKPDSSAPQDAARSSLPGQVVLVLQGGGALGAYQVGVFEALHEAGIEPDWVIGVSIGAINAALIVGNPSERRLERLQSFWDSVTGGAINPWPTFDQSNVFANMVTLTSGIPNFFRPNPAIWGGAHVRVGVESAAYYSTDPLRETLAALVDFNHINAGATRLTVGAVNVRSGAMRYFDNRHETLALEHVMASCALPPAFPAVRVEGELYWDGGIYSNTPIEAVLDHNPRRDSVIFAVTVWQPTGPEPESIWQVLARQKDIQYASRADSHIARQKQIHQLRHIIRELTGKLPPSIRDTQQVRELAGYGCGTIMHVVRLQAPRLDGEDHTKDIDFTSSGVRRRVRVGYEDTRDMISQAPWTRPIDPIEGVVVHSYGR